MELFSYYLENRVEQTAGVKWFDREFLPTTGVNIYDYPFNTEHGYTEIHTEDYDILVLQLEQLNENMAIIQRFLGLSEPFELMNRNMSSKKWYHLLYKEFKAAYKPPGQFIDALYSSTFMTHFYSEADIEKFRKKWDTGLD